MAGSLAHGIPAGGVALYIAGVGEAFGEEAVKLFADKCGDTYVTTVNMKCTMPIHLNM